MKWRQAAHGGRGDSPSRAVLLSLVIGLPVALALGLRALTPLAPAPGPTAPSGEPLGGPESAAMREHRLQRDAEDRRAAYAHAQDYARAHLLSGVDVHFPDLSPSGADVTRLRPDYYRVRSDVTWTDSEGHRRRRRFETDLRQGPADSRWRLMDTEFLDAPAAPGR